jgi:formylglycine-generating enzyme required for sulfatase activity
MRSILALASLLLALPAHALVEFDWVSVTDPGNTADDTGFGSVSTSYEIARFETTNAQYAAFLNAVASSDANGLYHDSMGSDAQNGGITRVGSPGSFSYTAKTGFADKPVIYVSFYDALRFTNWLHNGQPTGAQGNSTTEDGAYTITAAGILDNSIRRAPGSTFQLPNENEWYKAAYYASGSGYFAYPAGTSTLISCASPGAASNTANCGFAVNRISDVGSYTASASPSGTFDQGGNVWEWIEDQYLAPGRVMRGGSFIDDPEVLDATERIGFLPTNQVDTVGFRVIRSAPEPGLGMQLGVMLCAIAGLGGRRARR